MLRGTAARRASASALLEDLLAGDDDALGRWQRLAPGQVTALLDWVGNGPRSQQRAREIAVQLAADELYFFHDLPPSGGS